MQKRMLEVMKYEEPVLASVRLKGEELGEQVPMDFAVYGGLHKIGRQKPYFTLTYWAHRAGFPDQRQQGGAGHDEILKRFPQFSDLAALHLADSDGVPMHAVENGWYWMRGALKLPGSASASGWKYDYERKTPEQCLQIFAELWRLKLEEAQAMALAFQAMGLDGPDWDVKQDAAKAALAKAAEAMKPRWKKEAEACIARHDLQLFSTHSGLDVGAEEPAVESAAVSI